MNKKIFTKAFTMIRTRLRHNLVIVNSGFTMIELLVVISIIGILAALALASFGGAQKQARDASRKSDLRQYSTALENYANQNGSLYPSRTAANGVDAETVLCVDLSLSTCPSDPKTDGAADGYQYFYQSSGTANDGTASATSYVLWGKMENSTDYWVVCSTGVSGTKSTSNFSVSGGTCPL